MGDAGMFITFEGMEGSGKSTAMKRVGAWLESAGREVVYTREPGGSALGRELRAILLDVRNNDIAPQAELFLYLADRAQHLQVRDVLGLFTSQPAAWLESIKKAKSGQMEISPQEIEQLIAERAAARKNRDFKRGDEIRDMLLQKGIQLLDSPQGTTWNIK